MNARRRLRLGTMDQVLSSLSNILIVFAFARVSTVDEFGIVALVMTVATSLLAIVRGMLGTPIAILSDKPDRLRLEAGHSVALAASLGVLGGGAVLLAAVSAGLGWAGVWLGLALPLVLVQDVLRFHSMAAALPWRALISDGIWSIVSFVALIGTWFNLFDFLAPIGFLWFLGAFIAAAALGWSSRVLPRFAGLPTWWSRSYGDRLRFGGEGLLGAITSLLMVSAATLILGTAAVAALRGVGSVMGPLSVLLSAVTVVVVPELRRLGHSNNPRLLWRRTRRLGTLITVAAGVIAAGSAVIPDFLGELVLGETWAVAHPILPIAAVEYAFLGWLAVAAAGLRVQGRSAGLLQLRVLQTASTILLGIAGGLVVGRVWGFSLGLVVAAGASALYGRFLLFRPSRVAKRV